MMNTAKVNQIKSALICGEFSNQELNDIAMAVKYARSKLSKQVRRALQVGDQVKFNGRNGVTVGELTKVAIKYATVRTGYSLWRVPFSMLEAV
jgi:hypothetical protein